MSTKAGQVQLADAVSKPLSAQLTSLFQNNTYGGLADNMEEIRRDLEALGHRIDQKTDRIVVMIDDLDRCEPQKSVEVLQAVNLLLNFEYFIVFLGIDARITTRTIEETYKNIFSSAGASGYEYLDKIIQIPFRIPPPRTAEIEGFLEKVMGGVSRASAASARAPTSVEEAAVPAVKVAQAAVPAPLSSAATSEASTPAPPPGTIDEQTKTAPKSGATATPPPAPKEAFSLDELQAFKDIARYLRPNPRHLKRLVNVYRLVRMMAERRTNDGQQSQIILRRPAETIAWLAACSQWPYTTHLILAEYDEMVEDLEEGTLKALPPMENPLLHLLDQVKPQLVSEKQRKLDHDPDLLRMLLHKRVNLSWDEICLIRQYTINFNPSIEAELQQATAAKPTTQAAPQPGSSAL